MWETQWQAQKATPRYNVQSNWLVDNGHPVSPQTHKLPGGIKSMKVQPWLGHLFHHTLGFAACVMFAQTSAGNHPTVTLPQCCSIHGGIRSGGTTCSPIRQLHPSRTLESARGQACHGFCDASYSKLDALHPTHCPRGLDSVQFCTEAGCTFQGKLPAAAAGRVVQIQQLKTLVTSV